MAGFVRVFLEKNWKYFFLSLGQSYSMFVFGLEKSPFVSENRKTSRVFFYYISSL